MKLHSLTALLLAAAALSGCATCREHPVRCAVGVLVVGAIAAHQLEDHDPIGRAPRHGGFRRPQ